MTDHVPFFELLVICEISLSSFIPIIFKEVFSVKHWENINTILEQIHQKMRRIDFNTEYFSIDKNIIIF